MKTRKPLFSRPQLNVLILVLSAVIALLSFTVPKTPQLTLKQSETDGIRFAWPEKTLAPPLRTHLLLKLPPELASDAPETRLLLALLEDHIASAVNFATPPQPMLLDDYVRLSLPTQDTHRHALLARLAMPLSTKDTAEAQRRLRAMLAIDRPKTARLWSKGSTDLPRFTNWLSRSQLTLLSNQPLGAAERNALAQALTNLPDGLPWPAVSPATELPIILLPGRRDSAFDLARLGLLWLQPFADKSALQLRFEPRSHQSRLAITTDTGHPASKEQLGQLRSAALVTSTALNKMRDRWLKQLRDESEKEDNAIRLLEILTLYNRPADGLAQFGQLIEQLSVEQLQQALNALLDPDRYRPIPAQEPASHGTSENPTQHPS